MATIQFVNKGQGGLAASPIATTRVIEAIVNLPTDATMTTATDDIVVVDLPAGTVVVAAGIEQLTVGTGSGTLAARVGTVAMSTTLASTADVGTITAGAAVDTVVEATKYGRYPELAQRDFSL